MKRSHTVFRTVFFGVACLFAACVAVQIFIAGLAIFTDSSHWHDHEVFVRIFELFPLLMLIFGFAGKLPVSFRWISVVLLLLIFAQYFTAHVQGAGAFHPVIAAVLFWLTLRTAARSRHLAFPGKGSANGGASS
ncbi:DUF6220 domain-containing protein [Cohnella zeiphila]|uniref:Uncharacterized protein n=1 Tax=Cohnella zeiphila TaxID=2761120 RepID=A0A7X0VYU6_9BACL|nr:DUF6220 domain-containing protein [Cohnella zeiphila]MBB6735729.1 hypothetical protein [Cohnella zeiphila]